MFTLADTFQKLFPSLAPGAAECEKTYKLTRTIGEGMRSVVRVGVLKSDSRQMFAVKMISHSALNEVEEHMLAQEIEILQGLVHPNIVGLKDVFYGPNHLYMVTELLIGGDLFDRLDAKQTFSETEAAEAMQHVLGVIAFLHGKNIIHRDIKPENFLYVEPVGSQSPVFNSDPSTCADSLSNSASGSYVAFEGEIPYGDSKSNNKPVLKLTDFQLAIMVKPNELIYQPVGTPVYLAPEVISAPTTGYGREVDLWAAGILLYTLLAGYPPFYDENDQVLFRMIQDATAPGVSRQMDSPSSGMREDRGRGGCSVPFGSPEFDSITDGCMDVLRKLLRSNACDRFTAEQALAHPWVASGGRITNKAPATNATDSECTAPGASSQQHNFAARRRLVGAIRAVQAMNNDVFGKKSGASKGRSLRDVMQLAAANEANQKQKEQEQEKEHKGSSSSKERTTAQKNASLDAEAPVAIDDQVKTPASVTMSESINWGHEELGNFVVSDAEAAPGQRLAE